VSRWFGGIAKLLRAASRGAAIAISGDQFATIVVPQIEGVCSCVAVLGGGEAIAEGPEDRVDLIMGGQKALRLPLSVSIDLLVGQTKGHDFSRVGINANVQLAPGPAFRCAVDNQMKITFG
jgi:hypothetical protein